MFLNMIKVELLRENARLPEKGTEFSAGFDLYAVEAATFQAGEIKRIPLGFATEIPADFHARIESRSSMAFKGMVVLTGVVDADYRGEWMVIMQNTTKHIQFIAAGDRIAQAVVRPTPQVGFRESSDLRPSGREGGFGSTGR